MVKICTQCYEINAGGFRCHVCEGKLVHTDSAEARALPESVWKSQRVDYGARRGMIIRILAILFGVGVGLWGMRRSVPLEAPWSTVGFIASIILGFALWRLMHNGADRGVRIWVFHKGKVHKRRLARAMMMSVLPKRRDADPESKAT